MNHSTKSTTAVVTSVVGVLVAATAALAVTQLVDDPKVDPAPPTARDTGPPPQGPGHVIDPDTGRPFSSDVDDPPTN